MIKKIEKLKSGGFTLIELLVVIAIIGILSTIVLTSLSQSRAKAFDAKVKMQLRGFAGAAENYFTSQNPITYGPATNSCLGVVNTTLFNNILSQDGSPAFYIDPGSLPDGTQVFCGSSDGANSAYAVKATLYSGTDYWCVDSKGVSRQISDIPASGTFCP